MDWRCGREGGKQKSRAEGKDRLSKQINNEGNAEWMDGWTECRQGRGGTTNNTGLVFGRRPGEGDEHAARVLLFDKGCIYRGQPSQQ